MKKKLGAIIRIVVSVGILAYLFNSIFQKELKQVARNILESTAATGDELASQFKISTDEVALIRAKVELKHNPEDPKQVEVKLEALTGSERRSLIWSVGPRSLWEVFQRVSPWWFAQGVAWMGVVCLFGIIRWRWILQVQGLELKFWRAASIFFVGMFFNAFMLGSTGGDVIKAWYVAHETHHKKAEAVATVIVDRLIGLIALFVLTLIMMGIYWQRVFEDRKLIVFSIITVGFVVGTVLTAVLALWKGLADRLPGVRVRLERLPKYDMLKRMIDACRMYLSHPVLLVKTMTLSLGVHVATMLSIICIAKGLGIITVNGFVDYFLYLPIINTVTAIPVSISGFGVREGMYAVMFGEVGVAESAAIALSLLGFIATLFWSVVGAGFYLTHRQEVAAAEQEAAAAET